MNMNDIPQQFAHPFVPEGWQIPTQWDLDMPVVDVHAHVYPDKLASRAVDAVGDFYGYDDMYGGGTPDDLLAQQALAPISHFVVHSVAVTAHSVQSVNTFIAQAASEHPEFIGFGTMHPDCEDMEAEVERALASGIRGFKLHPDTQMVNMDDPRLMEFYEMIAGRVPLVMHTGDYRYDYSSPRRLKRVLKAFPDLVIDAAHLGGWSIYDVGFDVLHEELLGEERLFVDSSSTLLWIGARHMGELVRKWGASRVLFGTDYPMGNPALELSLMISLGLSDDELEQVLYKNAENFTGVKVS